MWVHKYPCSLYYYGCWSHQNSMHIILHYIEQKKDSIPDIMSSLCQVTFILWTPPQTKAIVYNLIHDWVTSFHYLSTLWLECFICTHFVWLVIHSKFPSSHNQNHTNAIINVPVVLAHVQVKWLSYMTVEYIDKSQLRNVFTSRDSSHSTPLYSLGYVGFLVAHIYTCEAVVTILLAGLRSELTGSS